MESSTPTASQFGDLGLLEGSLSLDSITEESGMQQGSFKKTLKRSATLPPKPSSDLKSKLDAAGTCTERRARFARTAAILSQTGLLDVTLATAELKKKTEQTSKDIMALKKEAADFVTQVVFSQGTKRKETENGDSGDSDTTSKKTKIE